MVPRTPARKKGHTHTVVDPWSPPWLPTVLLAHTPPTPSSLHSLEAESQGAEPPLRYKYARYPPPLPPHALPLYNPVFLNTPPKLRLEATGGDRER